MPYLYCPYSRPKLRLNIGPAIPCYYAIGYELRFHFQGYIIMQTKEHDTKRSGDAVSVDQFSKIGIVSYQNSLFDCRQFQQIDIRLAWIGLFDR